MMITIKMKQVVVIKNYETSNDSNDNNDNNDKRNI